MREMCVAIFRWRCVHKRRGWSPRPSADHSGVCKLFIGRAEWERACARKTRINLIPIENFGGRARLEGRMVNTENVATRSFLHSTPRMVIPDHGLRAYP